MYNYTMRFLVVMLAISPCALSQVRVYDKDIQSDVSAESYESGQNVPKKEHSISKKPAPQAVVPAEKTAYSNPTQLAEELGTVIIFLNKDAFEGDLLTHINALREEKLLDVMVYMEPLPLEDYFILAEKGAESMGDLEIKEDTSGFLAVRYGVKNYAEMVYQDPFNAIRRYKLNEFDKLQRHITRVKKQLNNR